MPSSSHPQRDDIDFANQALAKLDEERINTVERELKIPQNASPATTLERILSPNSSMSSNSLHNQQTPTVGYRVIGFGQCGLVFERPGTGYVVKIAKPAYEPSLWADFRAHFCVHQAFERQKEDMECCIPRVLTYVPNTNHQWWNENGPLFPETIHGAFSLPAMALITERILPLPRTARQALIGMYCPPSLWSTVSTNPTNRDCLARIYLGRRRCPNTPLPPNFSLRNYNLCLDQMLELNIPVMSYAAAMGEALAVIHWAANVDAYDIEFVLGSERDIPTYSRDISLALNLSTEDIASMTPHTDLEAMLAANTKRRITSMWVLDFNLCSMWEEKASLDDSDALISHLVIVFFENDPYYPLPLAEHDLDKELWETFSTKYLDTGERILSAPGKDSRLADLPRKFIDGCVRRERHNLAKGLGHGYREFRE